MSNRVVGQVDSTQRDRTECLRSTWYMSAGELMIHAHREHGSELLCFVLARTRGDRGRAEDIVRETMSRLEYYAEYCDPIDEEALASVLFAIAQRILIDSICRRNVRLAMIGLERHALSA